MSFYEKELTLLEELYAEFGEDVLYTATGGEPVTIRAVVDITPIEILGNDSPEIDTVSPRIAVKISELPNPQRGDAVIVREQSWFVKRIMPVVDGERELLLEKAG